MFSFLFMWVIFYFIWGISYRAEGGDLWEEFRYIFFFLRGILGVWSGFFYKVL